jgi:cystathionine gamma-lyase
MTHASIRAEIRQQRGIVDALVRLSVGIEDVADLQQDLDLALSSQRVGSHHVGPHLKRASAA